MTLCCGPSSALRPGSVAGLPIMNVPAGMGTMSNVTFVFGMVSVYFASAGACRAEVTPDTATQATMAPRVNGNVGRMGQSLDTIKPCHMSLRQIEIGECS